MPVRPPPPRPRREAAVVLAAGGSSRLGRPKPLLPVGSGTLLAAAAAPLLEAGVPRVVVVLGCEAAAVRAAAGLPDDPRLVWAINPAWAEGMASSLRCGLDACGEAPAALVALGDQLGVSAALVSRILEAGGGHRHALVAPVWRGRVGHPVLFGRRFWPELRAQAGDKGGRDVLRRRWEQVVQVPGEPLRDIDTEEDYRALLAGRPAPADDGLDVP